MNIRNRFETKVRKQDSCWIWIGAKSDGYGMFYVRVSDGINTEGTRTGKSRRMLGAHCVAYKLYIGPVPAGMVVRHTCDNRSCVNPKHLVIGSQRDNLQDHLKRGFARRRRLTIGDVMLIRRLHKKGKTYVALAKQFGCSEQNIGHVVKGRTFKFVRPKVTLKLARGT